MNHINFRQTFNDLISTSLLRSNILFVKILMFLKNFKKDFIILN